MQRFVDALRAQDTEAFLALFSHSTPWRYVGTISEPRKATSITYEELAKDLRSRSGWYESLFDAHGDDCFRDHVLATKGNPWIHATPLKFVPPGGHGEGRVYVTWRNEGPGRWVIDEIAEPSA
jgi:hypothetical protein